jgi:hypothetical protein
MLKTEMYFSMLLACQAEALRRMVLMLVLVIVEDQSNDKIRMTNDKVMTKSELREIVSDSDSSFEHSDFLRASTFELRH